MQIRIDREKIGAEKIPHRPVRATDSASSVQDGGHVATLFKNHGSAHRPNPQTHTVNARRSFNDSRIRNGRYLNYRGLLLSVMSFVFLSFVLFVEIQIEIQMKTKTPQERLSRRR